MSGAGLIGTAQTSRATSPTSTQGDARDGAADHNSIRKKEKKLPACDLCKAKRTKCYPVPPPGSCPRCIHEKRECTTTPVVRRPPRRKPRASAAEGDNVGPSASNAPSASTTPQASENHSPFSPLAFVPPPAPVASTSGPSLNISTPLTFDIRDLPSSLVDNLIATFWHVPQHNHPILPIAALRDTLRAVGNRVHELSLEDQTFAFAIFAMSALVSIDPHILGPGAAPANLEEMNAWPLGATDWASYGHRRRDSCLSLYHEALRLAQKADVTHRISRTNLASCYLLDELTQGWEDPSADWRPYGAAYMSQFRATQFSTSGHGTASKFLGMFFVEALKSFGHERAPITSRSDHAFVAETSVDLLEELRSLQKRISDPATIWDPQPVFGTIPVWGASTLSLMHDIGDSLTGVHMRQKPVDEIALARIVGNLSMVEIVCSTVLSRFALLLPMPTPLSSNPLAPAPFALWPPEGLTAKEQTEPSRQAATIQYTLLQVRQFIVLGWTCPAVLVYKWLRQQLSLLFDATDLMAAGKNDRLQITMQQVTRMATKAAYMSAEGHRYLTSLAHATHFRQPMTDTCLDLIIANIDANGGVPNSQDIQALESYRTFIRLSSFGRVLSQEDQASLTRIDSRLQPLQALMSATTLPSSVPGLTTNGFVGGDTAFLTDASLGNMLSTDEMDIDRWFSAAMLSFDQTLPPL